MKMCKMRMVMMMGMMMMKLLMMQTNKVGVATMKMMTHGTGHENKKQYGTHKKSYSTKQGKVHKRGRMGDGTRTCTYSC